MANDKKYWFKARKYGIGWVPATKEGWLVVLTYLGFVAASFIGISFDLHALREEIKLELIPSIGFPTVILLVTVFLKGEPLHWQWSKKK